MPNYTIWKRRYQDSRKDHTINVRVAGDARKTLMQHARCSITKQVRIDINVCIYVTQSLTRKCD
jgi:hypothetical protein